MAGYTQFWDCRICSSRQESDGVPKNEVCESCLTPLATVLLRAKFPTANLSDAGIDSIYWMLQAGRLADVLMRRWVRI